MRESEIEKAVCDYAKDKYDALCLKLTSPSRRGVPDRLVLFPGGKTFFVEFKAPGKVPTSSQMREHDRIRALGFRVFVVDDITYGKTIIENFA